MKLLIVTQVVDLEHPVLGFFHRWIIEFAKHAEHVHVICLQEGEHDLPSNVTVHSLGKESGAGRLTYLTRFYKLIWSLRTEYDKVFVHMNQIYVILGAPFWRLWEKQVGLWYVHKQVSITLKIATLLSNKIFSTNVNSFRVQTKKVSFVGHGIDLEAFSSVVFSAPSQNKPFVIAHFGRLTQIKNLDVLIDAFAKVTHPMKRLVLYGDVTNDADTEYKSLLERRIENLGLSNEVAFAGSIAYRNIPGEYETINCTVNLAPTGGMDKAVLESAAAGVPVFVSNESFTDFLGKYAYSLHFKEGDADDLADKINRYIHLNDTEQRNISSTLKIQSLQYSLERLIGNKISAW